jgi:thiamine pyrophosphate-dependent acetolactate synthase large subunit-like protein
MTPRRNSGPRSFKAQRIHYTSIRIVGDGGFAMLMAELSTDVQRQLPVKIIVLKNNSLSEVRFEQKDLVIPTMAAICRRSILSPSPRRAAWTAFAAPRFARRTRRWWRP